MAKWNKVGSVRTNQDGKPYLKVDFGADKSVKELTLKVGQNLTMTDPRNRKGITEQQLALIPAYVKYDVFLVTE